MNIGITNIINNLGMGFENIILLCVIIGGFIIYAKDFKLGLIMHMIATGLLFMWFYQQGYNYVPSLISFFLFLITLSLSLYAVSKSVQRGTYI